MTFGEKLQELRKQQGLSQEELAGRITVSRQSISKWELGTAVPDTENIVQLSKLFGVSTDYLLHDDYESDQDLPVVRTTHKALQKQYNHRLLSIILLILSVVGLAVCPLLAQLVQYQDMQTFHTAHTNAMEYLKESPLCFVVWLFVLGIAVSLVLARKEIKAWFQKILRWANG